MSPKMEADFDWGEVQATTPVFKKNVYQVGIKSIRAQAWAQTDKNQNPTGVIVEKISLRPEMKGVYDSSGKLSTEQNGKEIAGISCDEINLWMHSEGGRKMAKRGMMAILGYNPFDDAEEKKFNSFLKAQKVDLSWKHEETDDGYVLKIGAGWESLLVGKNVKAAMEPEIRKVEGKEDTEQQNYKSLSPVN